MNETIQTIIKRRSIRSYEAKQIPDVQLQIILECAQYAPSGGNNQYVRFLVIQNAETLNLLNILIREEYASREIIEGEYTNKTVLSARKPNYQFMYGAPTLITALGPRNYCNGMADSANALQNIQLAATSLGLGACWINQPHWLTGLTLLRNVFEQLGMRNDEDIFGSVAVGYPAGIIQSDGKRVTGRILLDNPRILS